MTNLLGNDHCIETVQSVELNPYLVESNIHRIQKIVPGLFRLWGRRHDRDLNLIGIYVSSIRMPGGIPREAMTLSPYNRTPTFAPASQNYVDGITDVIEAKLGGVRYRGMFDEFRMDQGGDYSAGITDGKTWVQSLNEEHPIPPDMVAKWKAVINNWWKYSSVTREGTALLIVD